MAEVQITMQDETLNGKAGKIVKLAGQLDETNVDEEAKKIYAVIDEMAEPNLLLDFADLTYINSKAIGYVTDWYSRTAAKNGKIVIARPQANILDILKVVGITQIITINETIDGAKTAFSGDAAAPAVPLAPEATPAPATPAPETPVPAAEPPAPVAPPAPETPATPAPETPATPAPETPAPEATPPAEAAAPVSAPAPTPEAEPPAPAAESPQTPPTLPPVA